MNNGSYYKNVACPCCGSLNLKEWISGLIFSTNDVVWKYDLIECADCGLGLVSPIPPDEILKHAYTENYCCYIPGAVDNIGSLKRKIATYRYCGIFNNSGNNMLAPIFRGLGRIAELLSSRYVTFSLGVPLQFPSSAKILDIGYGSGGWLLSMAKFGYNNLHGYDVAYNEWSSKRLKDSGIQILTTIPCLGESCNLAGFDLVRLEHVLEHHPSPAELINEIYNSLGKNGILVMTFPSRSNVSARYGGLSNAQLDIPRHLYHHTKNSVAALLSNSRFEKYSIRGIPVVEMPFSTFFPSLRGVIKKLLVSVFGPLYSMYARISGECDFITVIAVK